MIMPMCICDKQTLFFFLLTKQYDIVDIDIPKNRYNNINNDIGMFIE